MHSDSSAALVKSVVERICESVATSVYGHDEICRYLAGGFLIGGHVLLEGPPGIAKTLLARSFATALSLEFQRIQFTPDLMPSDITGVYIFDQTSGAFRFSEGPLFADIVLADEINRTPPKTQSALLEAMEERRVTLDGKRHPLGEHFFVIATQNPIEHEGTFPLPEAQLDRFLFKFQMTYPGKSFEQSMIEKLSAKTSDYFRVDEDRPQGSSGNITDMEGVVSPTELTQAREQLRRIVLSPAIAEYVYHICDATRAHPDLALGASPRAGLYLALSGKLEAALQGRQYVIPDDIKKVANYVLAHRIIFRPEIFETDDSRTQLLTDLISRVPPPDGRSQVEGSI